jgi:hypothetical protein
LPDALTPQIDPGAVIGRSWRIYTDNAGALIGSALLVYAVDAIASVVFTGTLWALASVVSLIVSTLYQGMVVALVNDVRDGRRDSSVGQLFASAAPVAGPLLLVAVLFGIGVGIGFFLLIVPGLYLVTIWSVVAPVTVLERPGVFAAFGRSRALVSGYGWAVFSVIITVFVVFIAAGIVSGLIAGGLGSVGRAVVQWIVSTLLAPLAAIVTSVLYFGLLDERR